MSVREPSAAFSEWSWAQLRPVVIRSIAFGNDPAHRSPFLHTTTSIHVAKKIWSERRQLYQPMIVRWHWAILDRHQMLDFSQGTPERGAICADQVTDDRNMEEALNKVRAYATKDKEVVCLRRPASGNIMWWDIHRLKWRGASEWALAASEADDDVGPTIGPKVTFLS